MKAVKLTSDEVMIAAGVGMRRHVRALHYGFKDSVDLDAVGWNAHMEGACGEMAVAKALGLFWGPSINGFKKFGDVSGLEVKTTRGADLIIRKNSPDERIYVLVTGIAPNYVVRGWTFWRVVEARKEWWQNPNDRGWAWFIPQADLEPLETLRAAMDRAEPVRPVPVPWAAESEPDQMSDEELDRMTAAYDLDAAAAAEELAQLDFDNVVPIFPRAR